MRLIGVSIVRNESDIIEAFVRTNLVMLDALYIIAHRCTDGTAEILKALHREGAQIRIMDLEEEAFRQEHYTNVAARAAFRDERADFVFPLDADEFVRAPDRASLEAALAGLPEKTLGAMSWMNYVTTAKDREAENPLMRMEHRIPLSPTGAFQLDYAKVVVGRWFESMATARILEGGHAAFVEAAQLPTVKCRDVALAHFPIRSPEHLARKAVLGWLALLLRGQEVEGSRVGAHWRTLFARLKDRGELDDADIRSFVEAYVPPESRNNEAIFDPLPYRVDLTRYASLRRPQTLLQGLMERAETLARIAASSQRSGPKA